MITSVPPGTGTGQVFSCATVFTQSPSTQHLLVVEFDAQTQNVSEHGHWQSLGFNHVPHQSENALYSELDLGRRTSEDHLVAPPSQGRSEWMNELFTSQYQYNGQQDEVPAPNSAGLIGKLCFILAFVAFSRPARYLRSVLTTNVRPGQWNPHGMPEDGREYCAHTSTFPANHCDRYSVQRHGRYDLARSAIEYHKSNSRSYGEG